MLDIKFKQDFVKNGLIFDKMNTQLYIFQCVKNAKSVAPLYTQRIATLLVDEKHINLYGI